MLNCDTCVINLYIAYTQWNKFIGVVYGIHIMDTFIKQIFVFHILYGMHIV